MDSSTPLKGLLVFYIDVGNLPPEKSHAHLEDQKHRQEPALARLPEGWDTVWIAQRNVPSRIETIKFD